MGHNGTDDQLWSFWWFLSCFAHHFRRCVQALGAIHLFHSGDRSGGAVVLRSSPGSPGSLARNRPSAMAPGSIHGSGEELYRCHLSRVVRCRSRKLGFTRADVEKTWDLLQERIRVLTYAHAKHILYIRIYIYIILYIYISMYVTCFFLFLLRSVIVIWVSAISWLDCAFHMNLQ